MDRKKIQTLECELRNSPGDSKQRVDLLNTIAWEVGFNDMERATKAAGEAHALAKRLGYRAGLAQSLLNLAFSDYFYGKFEDAMKKGNQALERFRELGDRNGEANTYVGFGFVHWGLGDFEKALNFMLDGLRIFQELGDERRQAWAMTSLGGVYENLGDYKNALAYHRASLVLFKKTGDRHGEGRALSGIGTVYQSTGKLEKALRYHRACLAIFREMESHLSEARALNDIGLIYQQTGAFDEAYSVHAQALALRRQAGTRIAEATSLLNLGRLFNQQNQPEQAIGYLNEALHIAEAHEARPKAYQAHEALAEAYERMGDYKHALQHYKKFHTIRAEVFSEEANARITNLQIRHEVERAEKAAEIHRLQNIELAEALENLKQTQAQLIQSEKMTALASLIAGLTHEVNTPIGVLRSNLDISRRACEKIARELEGGSETGSPGRSDAFSRSLHILRDCTAAMTSASERIAFLIENLKKFVHLDQAEFQETDVHEGIESTLELLRPRLNTGIRVIKNFGDLPRIKCYPNELNQVFMTLLVNAVEAIEKEGKIFIDTRRVGRFVQIRIRDTGRGIPADKIDKIFEIGFSQKDARIRMRIGLPMCYNVVRKHNGQIVVASAVGEGTTFAISLPV